MNDPRVIFLSVHGTFFTLGTDVDDWKAYIRRSPDMCGWFCWTDGTHDGVLYREDEPPVGDAMPSQWQPAFNLYVEEMARRRSEHRAFINNLTNKSGDT